MLAGRLEGSLRGCAAAWLPSEPEESGATALGGRLAPATGLEAVWKRALGGRLGGACSLSALAGRLVGPATDGRCGSALGGRLAPALAADTCKG